MRYYIVDNDKIVTFHKTESDAQDWLTENAETFPDAWCASVDTTINTPEYYTVNSRQKTVTIDVSEKTYQDSLRTAIAKRKKAYGTVAEQIEFITENGLSAWQTKVAKIKSDNPKPTKE